MEEELKNAVDAEIKDMIAKRDELNTLIKDVEGKYDYNNGKLEKSKEQLEYRNDLEKIEKEIQNLDDTKKEVSRLFLLKKQKEDEQKEFKKNYDKLQKDKDQLEEEIKQLKDKSIKSPELAEYENDFSKVVSELGKMRQKIDSNEKVINEINNNIEKLNTKYDVKSKKGKDNEIEKTKEEKVTPKEEVKKDLEDEQKNEQNAMPSKGNVMETIRNTMAKMPQVPIEKDVNQENHQNIEELMSEDQNNENEASKNNAKIEEMIIEDGDTEIEDADNKEKYGIVDAEYKALDNEENSKNQNTNGNPEKNDKYSKTEITIGRKVKIKIGNAVYIVSEKNMKNIVRLKRSSRLEILNKYNEALKGRYSEDFLKNLSKISCTPLYAIDKSNMPEKDKLELINRIIRQHENSIIADSGLEVGKIDIDRVNENIEIKKKYYEDLEALGYDTSRKRDKLEKVCNIKYDLKDLSKTNIINRLLRKEIDEKDKTIILAEAETYQTLDLSDIIGKFKPSGISKFISKLTGRELPKLMEVNETTNNKGENEKGELFRKALRFNKSASEKSKDNKEEQKHTKMQVEELKQSKQKQVSSSDGMEK